MNLGNMIESSLREIVKDREREAQVNVEDGDDDDEFAYDQDQRLTDEDYEEYADMIDADKEQDEEMLSDRPTIIKKKRVR